MASATKPLRIAVGSKHRRKQFWAERAGVSNGQILLRFVTTKNPAGEFDSRQARKLCTRLRKWWDVVTTEPAR